VVQLSPLSDEAVRGWVQRSLFPAFLCIVEECPGIWDDGCPFEMTTFLAGIVLTTVFLGLWVYSAHWFVVGIVYGLVVQESLAGLAEQECMILTGPNKKYQ
jgi:hypothetical protein